MEIKDFSVFRTLLNEVHSTAFGEPLHPLPHGKAQTLSWLIEEATGEMLSYKTLGNYAQAALRDDPSGINPNPSTLSLLVKFATGPQVQPDARHGSRTNPSAEWYRYRSGRLG